MLRWVVGSILHGVDPLSYFSFRPVLHDWCNKGRGMCYHLCGMMHIKEPLLLIGKSSPCCGSGFPLSLSEWSFTICDSPDTDVFVNLFFHVNKTWQLQKLYIKLDNRKTKKTVPVHLLVDQLDNGLVACLPAIHALSGCDSTSKVGPKVSMDLSLLEGFGVEELSPQMTSNAERFPVSRLKKTDSSSFD